MSEELSARSLGTVHPRDRCYQCGARYGELVMVLVQATRAWAWRCGDEIACLRRTNRQNQGRLFKAPFRPPRSAA